MAEPEKNGHAPADPLAAKTVEVVRAQFGDDVIEVAEHRGETTIVVAPARIAEVSRALRDESGLRYTFLADITAVDWLDRVPRYDVVYHLLSLETRAVVRLKVRAGDEGEEHPSVPSVIAVWPAANWFEREIWDLFGITFAGHPEMQRLMMPEDWEGHPLRKDYPLTGITLPEPHWGGQIPFGQPLSPGTYRQTLRTPGGIPGELNVPESLRQNVEGEPLEAPPDNIRED
jgi:NADH-quinone oxidoreductase subunit C